MEQTQNETGTTPSQRADTYEDRVAKQRAELRAKNTPHLRTIVREVVFLITGKVPRKEILDESMERIIDACEKLED